MLYGINEMVDLKNLPVLKRGVKTHYEGSIDKAGGNADWDWWLYQDKELNNEWVIFDYIGPGCVYNFVQHRYPTSEEPTFRFYFDGETEPRFEIKHSQFGEIYPFVEPIASRYIGPVENSRGPIRVVRSYVPMPFAKSCKITSDIKLEGYNRALGQGGWGHVIFQSYSEVADEEIKTFSINHDYNMMITLWKNVGMSVIKFSKAENNVITKFKLKSGGKIPIYISDKGGLVSGIKIKTKSYSSSHLSELKIKAVWDNHRKPDVIGSFGCLFSNELGYNGVRYLLSGMSTEGEYYNYFPMPFSKNALIEIINDSANDIEFDYVSVTSTIEYNDFYSSRPFGYFRSSSYYKRSHTEGSDSIIAEITGSGHIVGSIITGFGETPESYANCEGDVRIHIDGIRTPQIESDGSESYACYGWGFPTPPEYNPASGYDGYDHRNWSMTRHCLGDYYPFLSSVSFGIESGGNNDCYMEHSGMVFYYGTDEIKSKLVKEIKFDGCIELESYFEGDNDHIIVKSSGLYGETITLNIELPIETDYVIIRRHSDQAKGRQMAAVYVDDEKVIEYPWYISDHNEIKRWLEDDFTIPSKYVKGKKNVKIMIIPSNKLWNTFGLKIYAVS
ncbi:MAG: DUF2961 domain-containing protein [Eubacteriales bacterium]|nr:DUF2961 domain-containing protein [Eubacteriales bacterium]